MKLFEEFSFSKDNFIYIILTELEGGGRYAWLSIKNNEIVNRVSYDAISMRRFILNFLKDYHDPASNLEIALKTKELKITPTDVNSIRRLTFSIEVAELLYLNQGFKAFQEKVVNRIGVNKKSPDPSEESFMNNSDLFSDEQKKIEEIFQRYSQIFQMASSNNTDDVSAEENSVESENQKNKIKKILEYIERYFSLIMLIGSILMFILISICIICISKI
ncbi:MAG: hypothetical protein IPN33_04420 [Saprospiraceae bacterium]|nr:hypothetical protein [Saprospiraceae bacterium]